MTAAYRSHTVDEFYTLATVTLDKPASVASGDVLLAWFVNNDGSRTLNTLPSGWTQIASATTTSAPSTGAWLCKKVAGGSEPATYDFVFSYDFNGRAAIVAYQSGSDVSVYGTASAADAGSTTPYDIDAGAITVPDDDSKLVFFGAGRFTTTGSAPAFTPPSGYTERIDSGASYDPRALTVADITQASAGSSGAVTGTVARTSAGATRTVGVLVAITPVGGSTQISASGEVECAVISQVSLSSVSEHIPVGNYSDIPATVRDQSGTGLQYLTGTATSSDTDIATVSQLAATDDSGGATLRITGVAPGSATVTLTVDGVVSNSVAVTVNNVVSRAIAISPVTAAITTDEVQQFNASVDGESDAAISWSVVSGTGTVDSSGLFMPSAAGTVVVRAAYTDDVYAEATVTVTEPDDSVGSVAVSVTLRYMGAPVGNQGIDYVVMRSSSASATDTYVTHGHGTTDADGVLTIAVPPIYSGRQLKVYADTIPLDNQIHGAKGWIKVATAS